MFKDELLTVEEVAELLRTTPNTIYRWLRSGKIPGTKIGKEWRIKREFLYSQIDQGSYAKMDKKDHFDRINHQQDHVMVITTSKEDLYDFEADYFNKGLSIGLRLFKGCWWQHPDDVRYELSTRGLPIERLENEDRFTIVDLSAEYKRLGIKAPVQSWINETEKTIQLGYDVMWGSGSPHLLSCGDDVSVLLKFENQLDESLKGLPVVGVCPYIFEDCMKDFFMPMIDLMNHHSSVIFYAQGTATYLKN